MDQQQPLVTDPHAEIREEVGKLCARFPGEYWRRVDRDRAYPTEFVQALTEGGWLGALIPEEFGGAGLPLSAAAAILEEIHRSGGNAGACHAQMYIMGTILKHGSPDQKKRYLPGIASGALRLQAFGVTEPTSGTDTTALRTVAKRDGDRYIVNGQKIWTSRAEHSDLMLLLARTTPRGEVAKKTDGLSTFIVDMKAALGNGLTIRPIRTMMNHNTTEVFFDNMVVPAENLVGVEGKGFRYILDGMNAERLLISSESIGDAKWFIRKAVDYSKERVLFGRPIGQNQGVQFPIAKAYAQMRAAEAVVKQGLAKFEAEAALRRGSQHGQDARGRRRLGRRRGLHPDPWWFRLRRGIRHRTQVPRGAALSGGADQHQPDPVLYRRARARHAAELLAWRRNR
ncbi:acyl-CoA dehydrogenase family protein [Dankookia sp. P2]|uniref:acyl-CoA dehydrogenase family protein n=1 Tax=Dankookia sp. P2 TaxID=3423955 RepID=UPI003D6798DB